MRQKDMAWEVRDYLLFYPNAAVVNLGCGLDCTGRVSMIEGGTRGFGWMVLHGYIQWPLILCPALVLLQAGLGVLLMRL